MKYLDYYEKRGLKDEEEVFNFFMKNLQKTILGWDYFVDWRKIKEKVEDLEKELRLLNTLLGKENTEPKFLNLVKEEPRVKKALSLLIAVRANKLRKTYILDKSDLGKRVEDWHVELKNDYFKVKKELNKKTESELLKFYRQSGLKEVFERKDIKDLVDYYFGIEVGMDTHARKTRTGNAMEEVTFHYLNEEFDNLIPQATKGKIKEKWGKELILEDIRSDKAFDFAILNDEEEDLYLIEVNYYNVGGTKLKSTAGEYREYEKLINKAGAEFIWITDGLGWKQHENDLFDTFRSNDYLFNLKMISEDVLKEVIK